MSELKIGLDTMTPGCVEIVRWACKVVSDRAAALAACAIAAVVLHTGNHEAPANEEDTGVDVGLDGRSVTPKVQADMQCRRIPTEL